ncbi:2Fe-2S iron-sulfur cluster-binding protein [Ramlibacter sp. MAHUQ-53]|uniref:2Fe-2S iron-sulfur cluster-binding protein n=1 Tax=unclassified Ramlibacter TaxID=2617605 RepID=UPI003645946C
MPAEYLARLGPDGPRFALAADRTVLQSAEAAGLVLPNSCRNGTCRACIQQLESGRVGYRIEWPGLLAEEKAQGWILPCAAYPLSDLVLRATP